ncbi:MAG: YafY family transcriptional regulator [Chloroflexi bacterium]|nr:YafY family transcriptional regulator [Chloroflexota bacterium]
MRADRLISLLMLLQTRGQMTAQELADRLEVSPRTIYRDLDALSTAGVPVYAERGPQGGCSLLDSYRTNLTGLTDKEVRALFMFTVPGLLADLGADKASQTALLKLTAVLPAPFRPDVDKVRERILLDTAVWFQPEEPTPFLPLVQGAVWQERRLRMTYRRGDGQWVKRLVDPYGLVAKANVWYMVAGAHHGTFTFRVSRIQEAEVSDSSFTRPSTFKLTDYWQTWCTRFEQEMAQYTVTLRVSPGGAPLVVQSFGEGMVSLLTAAAAGEDGWTEISLTFASAEDACRRLLGLGTAVHVIAPPELRRHLHTAALEVAAAYKP